MIPNEAFHLPGCPDTLHFCVKEAGMKEQAKAKGRKFFVQFGISGVKMKSGSNTDTVTAAGKIMPDEWCGPPDSCLNLYLLYYITGTL